MSTGSWGSAGWPDCPQRIAYLRRVFADAVARGHTPKSWSFCPQGWGALACCWPKDPLERRAVFRQASGENAPRLLGLPFFIEPGTSYPFVLNTLDQIDHAEVDRLREWWRDPEMQSIREFVAERKAEARR